MMTTFNASRQSHAVHGHHSWRGLHDHSFNSNLEPLIITESLGTFILVLTIISTAIAAATDRPVAGVPYGSLAVPLAGGIALASMVVALGQVSGTHLNPAVTFGLAVNRRFPWSFVPFYVLAQFAGGIAAALLAWVLYGDEARTIAHLGATYPATGVGVWRTFAAEGILTFALVLVTVSVALNPKIPTGAAAVAIGLALAGGILIIGPITGAGLNPARAIGPMIPSGLYTDWWVYLVAELLGGVAAVFLYDRLLHGVTPPS
jgi:MIP family channel proteins